MAKQHETKDTYQEKIEAQIREIDVEIEKLEAKAHRIKANEKVEYREHINSLNARREHMEARLQELRDASTKTWRAVRDNVDAALTELHVAIKDAVTRFHNTETA